MDFGKMVSYTVDDNRVLLNFEQQTARIEIITDRILNVFSGIISEDHRSHAIEGDKTQKTKFTVGKEGEALFISTGAVTAKVYDNFYVDFFDGKGQLLCRDYRGVRKPMLKISESQQMLLEAEGHVVNKEFAEKVLVCKQMEGDEFFYGLGDKTGFLNKKDYEYVMWNTDDPMPHVDSFQRLYKSIPFMITLRRDVVFALFFDNSYRSVFDLGKECSEYYCYSAVDGNLDYYLISGETMIEVLNAYTYLTGTAPVPQKWALGYHQSRWGYITEQDVRQIAAKMRENRIPCDVLHLDIDYMEDFKVFTWNKEYYEDPKKTLKDLTDDGYKIVTIIDPGVKVEKGYEVYDTGVEKGYFATTPEGEIYVNEVWPGDAVYPDFGRKEVRDWWGSNHQFLLDIGVRGIWNDMNEPASFRGGLPQDVVFWDEDKPADHRQMHNLYGHNMAKACYMGLKERDGRRPFVITRACYAGTQKYSTAWTGDNHSIWAHLQMAIPQLCNLGLSGMPFVGTDIGGFGSDCTKELMCRWIQVGCFFPLFRNHSAMGCRRQEPWQFDEETLDIYRAAVELRYQLIPYFYDLFYEEEKTGLPIFRPLVLHYEKDAATRELNTEFLVGEKLLVAPVINQGESTKAVYLPEGIWYDYRTGESYQGPRWILADAPLNVCPMYIKAGAIIPVWPVQKYIGEKDTDSMLRLTVWPGEGKWEHFQDDGESFDYCKGGYNQYHCAMSSDGELKVTCVHEGYMHKYEYLAVICMGNIVEVEFRNGVAIANV